MPAATPPAPLPNRTVRFASGLVRWCGDLSPDLTVLGLDGEGYVVVRCSEGASTMDYALTACCLASAKGCGPYTDDDEGYTGCRACYAEVDPKLGGDPDPIVDAAVEVVSKNDPPAVSHPATAALNTPDPDDAPAPPAVPAKEKRMSRTKTMPAAEQFAALGLTDQDAWTPAMALAVKQKWGSLPVEHKVDDLRAELAAVEVEATPDAATLEKGGMDAVTAAAEAARLKRNAKVNAWRARNQIQAALDARALKFAQMRQGKATAKAKGSRDAAPHVALQASA